MSKIEEALNSNALPEDYIGWVYDSTPWNIDLLPKKLRKLLENSSEENIKLVEEMYNRMYGTRKFYWYHSPVVQLKCSWTYLGRECNLNGKIDKQIYPTCDGSVTHCKERGVFDRFGGFPPVVSTKVGINLKLEEKILII